MKNKECTNFLNRLLHRDTADQQDEENPTRILANLFFLRPIKHKIIPSATIANTDNYLS